MAGSGVIPGLLARNNPSHRLVRIAIALLPFRDQSMNARQSSRWVDADGHPRATRPWLEVPPGGSPGRAPGGIDRILPQHSNLPCEHRRAAHQRDSWIQREIPGSSAELYVLDSHARLRIVESCNQSRGGKNHYLSLASSYHIACPGSLTIFVQMPLISRALARRQTRRER